MTNEFWLGLALSIPLSILGNLISTPIQKWFETSSARASAKARARLEEQSAKLRLLRADAFELWAFGLVRLFIVGLIGALFTLIASFFYGAASAVWLVEWLYRFGVEIPIGGRVAEDVSNLANVIGMIAQGLGAVIVVNISMNTIRQIQQMRKVSI